MRLFLALFVSVVGGMAAPIASASPFDHEDNAMQVAAPEFAPAQNKGPQNILPRRRGPRIDNQQATARVRQVYANHKILGVQLIESKGPPVYRVKTLSQEGVVKYVFVDGTSGDLFE